jgi:hypothetical protein
MDDIGGHHPGIFDSLLSSAKDSQVNHGVHSVASALGIHGDWLTGDHSGISRHASATHVDLGSGAPGDGLASDGSGASQGALLPGSGPGRHHDQSLLTSILADADYLSTDK